MTPHRSRLLAWTVSGLCLAGSAGLIVNRHLAFAAAARDESRAAADLAKARTENEAVALLPKETRFACVPPTPQEETEFLLDLRRRAHLCGVSISRWSVHSSTYAKKEGEKNDPNIGLLSGITKVSCDLGLIGSYPALRALLADLWTSKRLYTVGHVDWTRTEKGSELQMSLGRYLSPKAGDPKP